MDAGGFTCPHCGVALEVQPGPTPQEVACPQCGGLSLIPSVEGSTKTPSDEAPRRGEDELNELRIRQLAAARRAAYRARSYCVIAAIVCVVAAVQLAWTTVALLRGGGAIVRPALYLLAVVLAAAGAVYFFRRAMQLDREAKQSSLSQPAAEPDFAALSDGSQRWKNLEDVQ